MPVEPVSPALFACGLVVVVAALVWRTYARARQRATLRTALSSADPTTRIAAVHAAVDLGLGIAAPLLLPHVDRELDPSVRVEIALAITRRQWEPGSDRSATAIRDWAISELVAHGHEVAVLGPAFTRLSDMGGPRLPPRDDAGHTS